MAPPAVLAAFMDIPASLDEEFNDWYNTDHIPQRMKLPGFLRAVRYRGVQADVSYACLYDLEDAALLHTDAYDEILKEGRTNWTIRLRTYYANQPATRRVYEQVDPVYRALPLGVSRGLWMEAFDVPDERDEEVSAWADGEYIPQLKLIRGVVRVRRLVSVENGPRHAIVADAIDSAAFSTPEFIELQQSVLPGRSAVGVKGVSLNSFRTVFEYPESWSPGDRVSA